MGRQPGRDRLSDALTVGRQLADETMLRGGTVVERGPTARVLDHPEHPYTRQLRASVPRPDWQPKRLGFAPPMGDVTRLARAVN